MDAEKSGSGRGLRSALAAAANRIRGRVRQGTTLHSIASIALGSGAGQAVAFLLAIPLARLYGPESFGLYAIFMVVVNSGTAIAGLRYELAIVLPKSDTWAHALYRLSVRSAAAVSATISLGFLVFYWVGGRDLYGGSLGLWLVGAGAAVFFTAGVTFVQYWMNREGDFRVLAKNRFAQAVLVPALQLIFALIWPDLGGLALGTVAGQAAALALALFRAPSLRGAGVRPRISAWEAAKRYKKMPLLNGPATGLEIVRNSGINAGIAARAVSGLGQYNMAWRLTHAPVVLISGAVSQVFFRRMAKAPRGDMVRLLAAAVARMAAVAAAVCVPLYFLAPLLFPALLGEQWREAGLMAQALIPWLAASAVASPVSMIFVAVQKQQWFLAYSVFYTAAPLAYLALTGATLVEVIAGLSWIMAGMSAVMLVLAFFVARAYDRGR